jgi:5'-nucleotidase
MNGFHILHTNDLHSHLEQTPKIFSLVRRFQEQWSQEGKKSLLFDIGDHMDRARMETEGTDGKVNGAILQATGYDAITLGNNELLTFSKEELRMAYSGRSFDVISSNVFDRGAKSQPSWLKPWKVFQLDHFRVGVVAATVYYPQVYELMGWDVLDPFQSLQRAVNQLRGSVDMIIVLSHLGIHQDQQLAQKINGIDLIIGAHTHHLLEEALKIGETWIVAAGKFGQFLGEISVEIDPERRKVREIKSRCLQVNEEKEAAEMIQLLNDYRQQADQNLSVPVAELDRSLQISWLRESPFGNLLADGLRTWVGAEIALVNSGQLLYSLPMGKVTKKNIHASCPHPINPVMLKMTGKGIRKTLEESLLDEYRKREIYGLGFRGKIMGSMSISGFTIYFDPKKEPYNRIETIQIGDRILRDDDEIEVATIDMFLFGSCYLEMKKGKLIQMYLPEFLRDLIIAQLSFPSALEECYRPRWIGINR